MSSFPIGFFDSGIGGISLWKAIKKILPNENSVYLSDSKNCPYGLKSKDKLDEIRGKNYASSYDKIIINPTKNKFGYIQKYKF